MSKKRTNDKSKKRITVVSNEECIDLSDIAEVGSESDLKIDDLMSDSPISKNTNCSALGSKNPDTNKEYSKFKPKAKSAILYEEECGSPVFAEDFRSETKIADMIHKKQQERQFCGMATIPSMKEKGDAEEDISESEPKTLEASDSKMNSGISKELSEKKSEQDSLNDKEDQGEKLDEEDKKSTEENKEKNDENLSGTVIILPSKPKNLTPLGISTILTDEHETSEPEKIVFKASPNSKGAEYVSEAVLANEEPQNMEPLKAGILGEFASSKSQSESKTNESNKKEEADDNEAKVSINENENVKHFVTSFSEPEKINPLPENSVLRELRRKFSIISEGHVFKKRPWLFCFWIRKYFVLTKEGILFFINDDGTGDKQGLWNCKLERGLDKLHYDGYKHPYRLTMSINAETVYLSFDQLDERDYWYESIQDIGRHQ